MVPVSFLSVRKANYQLESCIGNVEMTTLSVYSGISYMEKREEMNLVYTKVYFLPVNGML